MAANSESTIFCSGQGATLGMPRNHINSDATTAIIRVGLFDCPVAAASQNKSPASTAAPSATPVARSPAPVAAPTIQLYQAPTLDQSSSRTRSRRTRRKLAQQARAQGIFPAPIKAGPGSSIAVATANKFEPLRHSRKDGSIKRLPSPPEQTPNMGKAAARDSIKFSANSVASRADTSRSRSPGHKKTPLVKWVSKAPCAGSEAPRGRSPSPRLTDMEDWLPHESVKMVDVTREHGLTSSLQITDAIATLQIEVAQLVKANEKTKKHLAIRTQDIVQLDLRTKDWELSANKIQGLQTSIKNLEWQVAEIARVMEGYTAQSILVPTATTTREQVDKLFNKRVPTVIATATKKVAASDLATLQRGWDESTSCFIQRWWNLSRNCESPLPERQALGLLMSKLERCMAPFLAVTPITTFQELLERVTKFEEVSMPHGSDSDPAGKREGGAIQIGGIRSYGSPSNDKQSEASSSKKEKVPKRGGTPPDGNGATRNAGPERLTLKERLSKVYCFPRAQVPKLFKQALGAGLQLPGIPQGCTDTPSNSPTYCPYHQKGGHVIEDCFIFKDLLEAKFKSGEWELSKRSRDGTVAHVAVPQHPTNRSQHGGGDKFVGSSMKEKLSKTYCFEREKTPTLFQRALEEGLRLPEIPEDYTATPYNCRKYCAYHRKGGHTLNSCFTFKDIVEAKFQSGEWELSD